MSAFYVVVSKINFRISFQKHLATGVLHEQQIRKLWQNWSLLPPEHFAANVALPQPMNFNMSIELSLLLEAFAALLPGTFVVGAVDAG